MLTNPKFRLELADDLLSVQAFFNCWPNDKFLSILQEMLNGIEGKPHAMLSWEYNGVGCALPGYDFDDEVIEGGILFFLPFERIWVSNPEVQKHLEAAVTAHIKFHPADETLGERIISRAKDVLT